MNELEELLGHKVFVELMSYAGGTDYYVPDRIDTYAGQALSKAIGKTNAVKLIDYAGGSVIYIRLGKDEILKKRKNDIQQLRASGLTPKQISQQYSFTGRYTERTICRFLEEN